MKKLFFISFLFCFFLPIYSQNQLKTDKDIITASENALKYFVKGDIANGFNSLQSYTAIDLNDFKALQNKAKQDITLIEENYGSCVGYDFIKQQKAGNSMMKVFFMQKHMKYGFLWVFIFYNNNAEWKLVNISYTDDISQIF